MMRTGITVFLTLLTSLAAVSSLASGADEKWDALWAAVRAGDVRGHGDNLRAVCRQRARKGVQALGRARGEN